MNTEAMTKILFHLEQDEDGYPGFETESVWASPEGEYFRLYNVPFFAMGVSSGDLVQATRREDEWWFDKVITPSAHSTIRVLLCEEADVSSVRDYAHLLGCTTEFNALSTLVAIDIPGTVHLPKLTDFLETGEQTGRWTYEESALRHSDG